MEFTESEAEKLRREMCLHLINHGLEADIYIQLPKKFQVAILRVMWDLPTVPEPM